MAYSYERVAGLYDAIARAYSLGSIGRTRARHLATLQPGERVLYAGVGTGEEAARAAAIGARVTAVDLSAAMLRRFEARLDRGHDVRVLRQDVQLHDAEGYDVVVANYFLNVFEPVAMRRVLAHLVARLRPGGRLWVADFAPPSGGLLARTFARLYYGPVNAVGYALGLCALHPVYDYAAELAALALDEIERHGDSPLAFGPPLYEALSARAT